ncbi:hypothetical protein AAEU28_07240 [Pseudoalteromonas sp. SS15]|uniref:hypothetical protein n=1 Tax=Pseudoalteromonas sp. SS15 TaxID=3139393 RepID=UPI003BAA61BA
MKNYIESTNVGNSRAVLLAAPLVIYGIGFLLYLFIGLDTGYINFEGVLFYILVPLFSSSAMLIATKNVGRGAPVFKYKKLLLCFLFILPCLLLADRAQDIYRFVILNWNIRELNDSGIGFSFVGKILMLLVFMYFYSVIVTKNYLPILCFILVMLLLGNRQILLFFSAFIFVDVLLKNQWCKIKYKLLLALCSLIFIAFLYQFVRAGMSSNFLLGLLAVSGQGQDLNTFYAVLGWFTLYFPNPTVFSMFYGELRPEIPPFVYTFKFLRDIFYTPYDIQNYMYHIQFSVDSLTQVFGRQWASGYLQIYLDFGYLGCLFFVILTHVTAFFSRYSYLASRVFCAAILMNLFIFPLRDVIILVMVVFFLVFEILFKKYFISTTNILR